MTNAKSTTTSNSNGNGSISPSIPNLYTILEATPNSSTDPLTLDDQEAILLLLAQIRAQLPFLRDLTAEERKNSLGMGDKNRVFVGKVLETIRQTPDFLPRSFDIEQFQDNLTTFDRLTPIYQSLTQLRNLVDATMTAFGTETYEQALIAYRHAKASGQGASLDGMMAEMSQRFNRKSKKKAEDLSTSPAPTEG
jgi:hypothetical protein